MSDDALDLVLQKWAWAKGEEAAMKKTIEMCKTQVAPWALFVEGIAAVGQVLSYLSHGCLLWHDALG